MTTLFDPLDVRGLRIRNRIWVSPMCQYAVTARDGIPTDWHLAHLASFAIGGAGLVMAEATAVLPEGRISPQDVGIWTDEQARAWRRVTDLVRAQGAAAGIQLAHAGRKASTQPALPGFARGPVDAGDGGWVTVAPSAVPFGDLPTPRALTLGEVAALPDAFRRAARRSLHAGFDLVELHAAHGYLLHQFLSPLANRRVDAYGGSLENRARLLLEVIRAVRAEVGDDVPLFVRISATDWVEDGWDIEEATAVARWASDEGADLVDVSSGGVDPRQRIPIGPGYQVPFAERIRAAGPPVCAVGLITEPRQAADIVESGRADAVMLGREMLRDPHFAQRAALELGADADVFPPAYRRADPR